MTSTRQLHDLGQSLWLDNITRELLDEGTLRRYIEEQYIDKHGQDMPEVRNWKWNAKSWS